MEAFTIYWYALIGMTHYKPQLMRMLEFMTGENEGEVGKKELELKKFNIIDYALKGARAELKRARADKNKENEEKVKADLAQLLNIKKVGKSDVTFKQEIKEGKDE